MKPSTALTFLATVATTANATSLFANVPNPNKLVIKGETHDIVWISDALESLEVCLIQKEAECPGDSPDISWKYVDCLFVGKAKTPGGRLSWEVHDWYTPGDGYAFRLEAEPRGFGKWLRKRSVDMTNWFSITEDVTKIDRFSDACHFVGDGKRTGIPRAGLQRVLSGLQPGIPCGERCPPLPDIDYDE